MTQPQPRPSIAPPPSGSPSDNMGHAVELIESRLQWGDDQAERLCAAHKATHGGECKVKTQGVK
ncbi:MAG TPA: hypothetical protein ENI80_03400 [Acidiferrobacteraceae bacterium]|nr:hypothetical protein [Acidiferrobacteraceae bacterium]